MKVLTKRIDFVFISCIVFALLLTFAHATSPSLTKPSEKPLNTPKGSFFSVFFQSISSKFQSFFKSTSVSEKPKKQLLTQVQASPSNILVQTASKKSQLSEFKVKPSKSLQKLINLSAKLTKIVSILKTEASTPKTLTKTISETLEALKDINSQNITDKSIKNTLKYLLQVFQRLHKVLLRETLEINFKLNRMNKNSLMKLRGILELRTMQIRKKVLQTSKSLKIIKKKISYIEKLIPSIKSACNRYNNCGECTKDPKCGWCILGGKCTEGGKNGPADNSCTYWDYSVCSGPEKCTGYSSCHKCIAEDGCGWCNNPSRPRCIGNTDQEEGKCKAGNFISLKRSLNSCPHLRYKTVGVTLDQKNTKPLTKSEVEKIKLYLKLHPYQLAQKRHELNMYKRKESTLQHRLNSFKKQIDYANKDISKTIAKTQSFDFINEDPEVISDSFKQISDNFFKILSVYLKKDESSKIKIDSNLNDLSSVEKMIKQRIQAEKSKLKKSFLQKLYTKKLQHKAQNMQMNGLKP